MSKYMQQIKQRINCSWSEGKKKKKEACDYDYKFLLI